jgi:uncharacterized protein
MAQASKRMLAVLCTLCILATGVLVLPHSDSSQVSAQSQVTQTPSDVRRIVSVTGSGSVNATPDQAVINLGVQTQAETASQALDDNSAAMTEVVNTLRAAGIASADIRTQSIQLYPQYEVQPTVQPGQEGQEQPGVSSYTAVNTVQMTVKDLDSLGTILDQIVAAGGNRIDSITMDVSNADQSLQQAREAAYQNASQKAEQLADLAGMQLGSVVSISESSFFPQPVMAESRLAFDQAAQAVPINPGSQAITVDIQVTYELIEKTQE